MSNPLHVNREALERALVEQMRENLKTAVAAGQWSQAQADKIIEVYKGSDALQQVADIEQVRAIQIFSGQVR